VVATVGDAVPDAMSASARAATIDTTRRAFARHSRTSRDMRCIGPCANRNSRVERKYVRKEDTGRFVLIRHLSIFLEKKKSRAPNPTAAATQRENKKKSIFVSLGEKKKKRYLNRKALARCEIKKKRYPTDTKRKA